MGMLILVSKPGLGILPQQLTRSPRCDDVDDGVPKTLERKHKGGHVFKWKRRLLPMDDRIHAVGARRNPCNKHGGEK